MSHDPWSPPPRLQRPLSESARELVAHHRRLVAELNAAALRAAQHGDHAAYVSAHRGALRHSILATRIETLLAGTDPDPGGAMPDPHPGGAMPDPHLTDGDEVTPEGVIAHADGSFTAPAGHTGSLPPAPGQRGGTDLPVALDRTRGPRGASRPQGGHR